MARWLRLRSRWIGVLVVAGLTTTAHVLVLARPDATRAEFQLLGGPGGPANAVVVRPDGVSRLTGGEDRAVKFWSLTPPARSPR